MSDDNELQLMAQALAIRAVVPDLARTVLFALRNMFAAGWRWVKSRSIKVTVVTPDDVPYPLTLKQRLSDAIAEAQAVTTDEFTLNKASAMLSKMPDEMIVGLTAMTTVVALAFDDVSMVDISAHGNVMTLKGIGRNESINLRVPAASDIRKLLSQEFADADCKPEDCSIGRSVLMTLHSVLRSAWVPEPFQSGKFAPQL